MIKTVIDLLEHSAAQYPTKIALKDSEHQVSFKSFQENAQRIGSGIRRVVKTNYSRPILVMVDRTLDPIVSFMGVHYSGNFYVPVDNKTPEARLQAIVNVIEPVAVIGHTEAEEAKVKAYLPDLKYLSYPELLSGGINEESLAQVRRNSIDTDPAYAIFTSGSTGIPKAVAISQRSLLDLNTWLCKTFHFNDQDIIGNQTPFYFDASVKDIYISLRTGATLYIIPPKCFVFPKLLAETLQEENVSTILWATSAVVLVANSGILEEHSFPKLRKVFFAGEAMFGQHLNIWKTHLPQCEYVNIYGPTEITVDCTYYIVNREFKADDVVPIGIACENKQVMILDDHGQPVTDNAVGEIAVRGTGLALGYYNNPEQTNKVFVQTPYHNHYQDLIYKTGDNGRFNNFGEIEFVGRQDAQIKHMGNRIELGEIEAATYSIKDLHQAAAIYDKEKSKIVLYYTAAEEIKPVDFLKSLAKSLPKYMFPNKFVFLPEFPMNQNGKVNRKELAARNGK